MPRLIARLRIVLAVQGLLLLATTATAQGRQDFSGRWVAVPESSPIPDGRGQPDPASVARTMGSGWGDRLTIDQNASALVVERAQFSVYDMQAPMRFLYALDGSESRNTINMGRGSQELVSRAGWQDSSLVITTTFRFSDPRSGRAETSDLKQLLSLDPSGSLVISATVGGALGGTPFTAATTYKKDAGAPVPAGGAAPRAQALRQDAVVLFETEKGTIEMEIDSAHAPVSAANFLKYVDAGFFEGGTVNRSVRPDNTLRHDVEIQVIQFQIDPARQRQQFPPIPLERTSATGLKHVDGTLSMARNGPDTATASFSIVIGDQPEMDFGGRRNPDGQGFAAFGRVVRGMDVVRAIQASPTGPRGPYGTESLEPPIRVLKAYRRKDGA